MTNEEKIQYLEEAIEMIEEAQGIVEQVLEGTGNEANFNAYGKYGFDQLLGNGNRYDSSIFTIIDEIEDLG